MRLIRNVRRSVSKAVLLSLATALVLSRVDYCSAPLTGLLARQLCWLQSIFHAAARIVFSTLKFDHVTPLLRELHWLWIPERITFKLSCLVFWSFNGTAPVYLADRINRATDVTTRRSLLSSSSTHQRRPFFQWLVAARLGIALSRLLLFAHGTAYRRLLRHRPYCRLPSPSVIWRHICSQRRISDADSSSLLVFCLPNITVIMLRVLEVYPKLNVTLTFSCIIIKIIRLVQQQSWQPLIKRTSVLILAPVISLNPLSLRPCEFSTHQLSSSWLSFVEGSQLILARLAFYFRRFLFWCSASMLFCGTIVCQPLTGSYPPLYCYVVNF